MNQGPSTVECPNREFASWKSWGKAPPPLVSPETELVQQSISVLGNKDIGIEESIYLKRDELFFMN